MRQPFAAQTFAAPLLLQMLACSFLWASAFILMKLAAFSLSPMALTALRGLMGAVLIGLWLVIIGHSIRPRGRELRDWIILGLLQGLIPNSLTAYALLQISAGLTSMVQASAPLIVAVIAPMLFASERLTAKRGLGLLIGFGGMLLLVGPPALGPILAGESRPDTLGILAMLAVACSYALGNVYVRSIPAPQPIRLAFGQQLFAGLPSLAYVLIATGPAAFAPAQQAMLELLLLGVFGTALPIVLYMYILRKAGPTLGSMNGYFLPPWTIILGFLLLGEPVSMREILATMIVLLGVAIVSRQVGARR